MTVHRQSVTVVQGEFVVSVDPMVRLSTVLGSCVSVCLFDPTARIGGMNHFLLATHQTGAQDDLKYGVNAMELLINRLLQSGADRKRLVAKVFGGARMTAHARDIGASNVAFALAFLEREQIACLAKSVGGTAARRVQFIPTTGAARQMQVTDIQADPVATAMPPAPTPGITLF